MSLEEFELTAKTNNSDENFKPLISSCIFEQIFESQPTNIETICCIAVHIINYIQTNYQL